MRSVLQAEIKKKAPFDAPEQEACLNLMRTHAVLLAGFSGLFRGHGISSAQYNVLRILRGAGAPGLPTLEIAERMITWVPDVTRLVDRLEQAGLVSRARTREDRRLVLVNITEKGLSLLTRLDRPVMELHRRQLGHLTRAELAKLNRLLVKARHGGR